MSKQSTKLRKLVSLVLAAIVAVSCFSVSAAAAEKATANTDTQATDSADSIGAIDPACQCFTFFTDSQGWGNVYAYAWDADGNPLLGEWPGTPMQLVNTNDYGEPIFGLYIPYEAVGFIFNSGFDGEQTCDIENTSAEGYYITGKRDRDGHLVAYPWNYTPTPEYFYGDVDFDENITIADATMISFYLAQFEDSKFSDLQLALADVDGSGTVTIADVTAIQFWLAELEDNSKTGQIYTYEEMREIKFINTCGWQNVYVYAWDKDDNPLLGSIPGREMTYMGEDEFGRSVYTTFIPDNAHGLTFYSSMNGECTVEIDANRKSYEPSGLRDKSNRLRFDNDPDPEETRIIKFINNCGWSDVYIYAWDNEGDSLVGDWPGMAMTYEYYNSFGEPIYTATIPASAVSVVFNCPGTYEQSFDVILQPYEDLYYPTGEKDEGGNLVIDCGIKWAPATFDNVYFMNTENWDDIYIYTWDKSGLPLTGAWPGSMMSMTGRYNGTERYYYEFWTDYYSGEYNHPRLSEVAGIIFSDGKGKRSIGVKVSDDYDHTYYPSRETDSNGNIIVTPNSGEDISGKIHYIYPKITITDKTNSGQLYAYAWNEDGDWLFGGEPGMEMTSLGDGKYSVYIPDDTIGMVFHNENEQTVEVTDFTCTSFCIDGTKDENGYLNLIPQDSNSIIFADSQNWEKINVCAWDSDGNGLMGDLPGTAMTFEGYSSQGERIFSANIPENAALVRFASGINGEKTVEAKADKEYYRPTGKTDEEGNYLFYIEPELEPEYEGTFYLTDNLGWGTAYVYAWNAEGEPINGEWPGNIVNETITNTLGENEFVINVPKGAVGVVVSNGNDQQTEDITNFNESYWPSGQQNELGHYIVRPMSAPSI